MDLLTRGLTVIILVVGIVIFTMTYFAVSTNLSLKKIIIGGVAMGAAGTSMLIMGGVPLNETFVGGVLCLGFLGAVFIFGRWLGNRAFTQLKKSNIKKHQDD